jgi:hypothetical protein
MSESCEIAPAGIGCLAEHAAQGFDPKLVLLILEIHAKTLPIGDSGTVLAENDWTPRGTTCSAIDYDLCILDE